MSYPFGEVEMLESIAGVERVYTEEDFIEDKTEEVVDTVMNMLAVTGTEEYSPDIFRTALIQEAKLVVARAYAMGYSRRLKDKWDSETAVEANEADENN